MENTNTINAAETQTEHRLPLLAALSEAKRLSGQYELASFVYQTGPTSFNYRFNQHNPACGVLVARFDKTGRSC